MKFAVVSAVLLLSEWLVVWYVSDDTDLWRLTLVGIVPLLLECLKNTMLRLRWPRQWATTLVYDLAVELIRYILIVLSLLLLTSFLSREMSLYALLFCSNFLLVLIVNALTHFEIKTQQEKI